ncbi:MAG: family 10 glycosylhydrolase, partial [Bacteroidaceae bacterium]|nr:family 10 glycosylhydrolase [Bacteroidaceae bacterium]
MRKLFFLIILFTSLIATASSPKYEMRAVWLTTNWGLDWPSKPATNSKEIARQKEEMRAILDEVASLGFNTIFFQARTRGEVFYNSQIEPWSHIVSGKPGVSPGYDPLAFVVEECHNRGMECHAWIISIPAGSIRQAKRLGNNATPARHPEMCIKLKNEWYLDPGHPQTATYLASIAKEIAT